MLTQDGTADGAARSRVVTGDAASPGGARPLTPRLLLRPVAIFAASRVAVLLAMWFATQLTPGQPEGQVFKAWDASWYLRIIGGGYPGDAPEEGIYAFFPVFPLLGRAVSQVPGVGDLDAGLVVGALGGVAAAVVIWLLCRRLYDEQVADRAVALFAFFPGSWVLSSLYAEGVMLALSAACLWALIEHRWLLAGVLAAVGTASRPNAIALIVACAWAALVAVWLRREWRSLVAPALAPLGFLGFLGLLWARTGEPDTWFRVQRQLWQEQVSPLAIVEDLQEFWAEPFGNTNNAAVIVGAVLTVVGLVLLLRARVPSVLTVYASVVLALALFSETLGPRPRFVLTAFPLFLAFALHLRGTAFTAVVAISATVLGAFTVASLTTVLFTP